LVWIELRVKTGSDMLLHLRLLFLSFPASSSVVFLLAINIPDSVGLLMKSIICFTLSNAGRTSKLRFFDQKKI
jgi:hypothetical protein